MSFKDLERKISMAVPMDHNQQDNYDYMQAEAMDPADHEVDNIPQATQHHDGTQLPVPESVDKTQHGSMGGAKKDSGHPDSAQKAHFQKSRSSGTTKTGSRKK
jgi:hypothetical protein